MARAVADTEMIRRQNRHMVLETLRRLGPLSRSGIAEATGLSNASLTAIGADLMAEGVLVELPDAVAADKGRGRPAVHMSPNRSAGYVLLMEIDVNRCRTSLIDYGGILVDRLESPVTPVLFAQNSAASYFTERIEGMLVRNPDAADAVHGVSISVQGILDGANGRLEWSPIAHLAGQDISGTLRERFGWPVRLYKRGRLMAEGMRRLQPEHAQKTTATVYLGSTVGMGLSFPPMHRFERDLGTEFGHMNHIAEGAQCRCGGRGCIEAYAADYAILRAAYSVPEHTPPARAVPPDDFRQIVDRAHRGERNARHAFTLAGKAIGYGLGRLISLIDIDRIVLLGPGTAAYDLMQAGLTEGMSAALTGRMRGLPPIALVADAGEPIYHGLTMTALSEVDHTFAHRNAPALSKRPAQ